MQLLDVATASTDVGASSARLKKVARIADLLRRAGEQGDAKLVAVVVSWLSGELPQRQIGVGWAALRSLPPAATEPSLTVLDVDARFSEIGTVAGKGSQARRAELVTGLFSQATDAEQTFLRRLLGGELRQGALLGVMADAVAKAADVPAAAVRRAAMLGGALPAVAAAALTAGEAALEQFTLKVGQPVGPMLAQTASGVAEALERLGGTAVFEAKLDGARVQIHRAGDAVSIYTRSLDDVTVTTARGGGGDAGAARHRPDRRRRGDRAPARQPAAPVPGHRIAVRPFGRHRRGAEAQPLSVFVFDLLHLDGTDLLDLPTSDRLAAMDAIVPAVHRVDRLITDDADAAQGIPRRDAGGRPRRRDGEVADGAL